MSKRQVPKIGFKTILVFLSLALIVSGSAFMIFDPERVFEPELELDFDGPAVDETEISGTVDISTSIKDSDGEIIRRYDPDQSISQASLLDPATDSDVQSYVIDVDWSCSGSNIDWTTLRLDGNARVKYIGIGYYGQAIDGSTTEFGAISKSVDNVGTETVEHNNLDALVPDSLPDVKYELLHPDDIKPTRQGVSVPQRTPEKHAVIFKFTFDFTLSVNDLDNNRHSSSFVGTVELRLTWAGSTFDVEWNNEEGTESAETIVPPVVPDDFDPDTSLDTVLEKDMTQTESDEFIRLDIDTDTSVTAASIFGGGVTEDVGLLLIGLGVGLLVFVFLGPEQLLPKWRK